MKDLFNEFETVSAKQWKQKIQYDLKGADYNNTLIWNSNDGISVKPFYHCDDYQGTAGAPTLLNWKICQRIYAGSAPKSNVEAKRQLSQGAESLWLTIPSEKIAPEILFAGIDLEKHPVFLKLNFLSSEYIEKLKKYFSPFDAQVHIQTDIIGNLAATGNWYSGVKEDHAELDNILEMSGDFNSVISINTELYQNAGANIPQQLGYALAHVNEYFNHFTLNGSIDRKNLKVQFLLSTGSNYFFEIAKIRALRLIFSTLAKEYQLPQECIVIACPSHRNKTLYDYNVNLLRTTTESMSAVIGGADFVSNLAYDEFYHKSNEFSSRIAKNQLLILKNESYLDQVNPADGTFYLEELTQQFSEKALEIFKGIEKGGGFLKQLKEGIIQKKIAESAAKEQQQVESGEMTLVGTNKYIHPQDLMKGETEIYPFLKHNPRKTLIRPIIPKRLSEKTEKQRMAKEQ